jgi:hypothetical protein
MSQLQYRGALAETLIGKDFPGLPLFDTTAIPPLDWKTPAPAMIDAKTGRRAKDALSIERNYRGLLAQNYVGQLGECILRSTPRGSVDVLKTTDVASETEAWTAITPQIAGCIPNAQKVTFTRADLRSALAVSYYRLASSAKQQQAAR